MLFFLRLGDDEEIFEPMRLIYKKIERFRIDYKNPSELNWSPFHAAFRHRSIKLQTA